jgi:hypothetical protein
MNMTLENLRNLEKIGQLKSHVQAVKRCSGCLTLPGAIYPMPAWM